MKRSYLSFIAILSYISNSMWQKVKQNVKAHGPIEWICYVISEEIFEVFSPIWSHVNETEKKIVKKSKMQNFEKQTKKKKVWRYGEKVPVHQIWH